MEKTREVMEIIFLCRGGAKKKSVKKVFSSLSLFHPNARITRAREGEKKVSIWFFFSRILEFLGAEMFSVYYPMFLSSPFP